MKSETPQTIDEWMKREWPVRFTMAGGLYLRRTYAGNPDYAWEATWQFSGYTILGSATRLSEDGAIASACTPEEALAALWDKMLIVMKRLLDENEIPPASGWTNWCIRNLPQLSADGSDPCRNAH